MTDTNSMNGLLEATGSPREANQNLISGPRCKKAAVRAQKSVTSQKILGNARLADEPVEFPLTTTKDKGVNSARRERLGW